MFGDERGSSAAEFALILPLLTMLLFGFYEAGRMWKEEVEKRSKGRVGIRYLHSRQLGEERPLFEGVLSGTIDAMVGSSISLTVFAGKPSFEALQLPFLISSYDNLAKILSSDAAMAWLLLAARATRWAMPGATRSPLARASSATNCSTSRPSGT